MFKCHHCLPINHLIDAGFDFDRISHESQHPVTLASHVMAQIGESFKNPDDRAVALLMVEHLAPHGWLEDGVLQASDNPRRCPHKISIVFSTNCKPWNLLGLFARDLAECLTLQLDDMGLMDDHMRLILTHLDALHDGVETLAQRGVVVERPLLAWQNYADACLSRGLIL